jgi:hypothetical protein
MRILVTFGLLLLAISGCAAPSGGPPSDENDNVNSNGDGGGPTGQNDNGSTLNDNAPTGNDNDSGANDNGSDGNDNDDSGELPTAFRLDGVWDDNGRHVIVEQNGVEVVGNYFTERYCDREDGPVDEPGSNTDATFFDFRGTLNNGEDVLPGDLITGEVNTCRWGFESGNGFVLADLTLTVVDEDTMSGEWESADDDGDGEPDFIGSITLTREQ